MMHRDEAPTQPLRQHLPDRPTDQLVPGLQTHFARDRGLADVDGTGEAGLAGGAEEAVRAGCGLGAASPVLVVRRHAPAQVELLRALLLV